MNRKRIKELLKNEYIFGNKTQIAIRNEYGIKLSDIHDVYNELLQDIKNDEMSKSNDILILSDYDDGLSKKYQTDYDRNAELSFKTNAEVMEIVQSQLKFEKEARKNDNLANEGKYLRFEVLAKSRLFNISRSL